MKTVKKTIIIIGIIVFIIIIFPTFESVESKTDIISSIASKIKTPSLCYIFLSEVKAPNTEGKSGFVFKYPENTCLLKYAKKTKDIKTCESISIIESSTYANSNEKNYCYEYMAEIYSDPELCKNIEGPAAWRSTVTCRAIATLDIDECLEFEKSEYDHLPDSISSDCLYQIYNRTKNYDKCIEIQKHEGFKNQNIDGCLERALCGETNQKERKKLCDKISENRIGEYFKSINVCYEKEIPNNCMAILEREKIPSL